jgi:hypothetical protein
MGQTRGPLAPLDGNVGIAGQRYLYKPEQTSAVKGLIERLWRRGDWQGVGQGFDDNAQSLLRTIQLGRQHDG